MIIDYSTWHRSRRSKALLTTSPMTVNGNHNWLAKNLKHEGVRVGEIIAYRCWQVFKPAWFQKVHDRLHSVYIRDYIWHPDQPASGDVRTHGIYSFRDVIRCKSQYGYSYLGGPLLFGRIKIWGEIVEHEWGYRSQFGKIVSLDYGDPQLLDKFRKIYRNQVPASEAFASKPLR